MNFTQFSLGVAIIISAGITVHSSAVLAHNHKADNNQPELGLQLYSLRNQLNEDAAKAIEQIHDWGIKVIEGGGNLHGNSISEFKAMLDENEISVVSVDTSFEEVRDNPMGVAYKAHYYGAKYATIYWIPHNGKVGFNIDNAKAAVKLLNEGGKILKAHGITLQYHPHGYEFSRYENGTLLDYIIQNTTEANFEMDVFWIKQGGGDPVAILQKYPNRFTSIHLKDRLVGTPDSTDGKADVEASVALGTGDVEIAAVIKEAKKQGIHYFFLEDESTRVLQQVPKSLAFVKPLIE